LESIDKANIEKFSVIGKIIKYFRGQVAGELPKKDIFISPDEFVGKIYSDSKKGKGELKQLFLKSDKLYDQHTDVTADFNKRLIKSWEKNNNNPYIPEEVMNGDYVGKITKAPDYIKDEQLRKLMERVGYPDYLKEDPQFRRALEGMGYDGISNKIGGIASEIIVFDRKNIDENINNIIAEAYHKAKADGTNPELVKAVEQSLKSKYDAELKALEEQSLKETPQGGSVGAVEAKVHKQNIHDKFRKEFEGKGIPKEQVDGAIALMEARAKSWASEEKGRNADDWYGRIADVKSGEFETSNILYQLADEIDLFSGATAKEAKPFIDRMFASVKDKDEAKQIYRRLSSKYHPDKNTSKDATEIMQHLNSVKNNYDKGIKPKENVFSQNENDDSVANEWQKRYEEKLRKEKLRKEKDESINEFKRQQNKFRAAMSITEKVSAWAYRNLFKQFTQEKIYNEYNKAKRDIADKYKRQEEKIYNEYITDLENARFKRIGTVKEAADKRESALSKIKENRIKEENKAKIVYEELTGEHIQWQKDNGTAKGALETLKDGRVVIHALESPDFSTMVHEIGHIFEKDLTEAEQRTVKDFGGSEAFGRGFEKYLRDGKAPTTELKALFEKFKQWLTDIYKTLKGSPIEKRVTPEIKQIFDRLLTEQSLKQPSNKETQQKQEVENKTKPASELNKNEGKTTGNTTTDGKVQSRVGINDNKEKNNVVQSGVDNKSSKGEVEINETQKKQNVLVDAKNEYNKLSVAKKRSADGTNLKQRIIELSKDLGFKVSEKNGRISVRNQKGKEAGKISFKENIPESKKEDIDIALQDIEKGILDWNGDPFSQRVDLGITRADIRKGIADLKAGKVNTVPAKRLVQAIKEARAKDGYEFIQGAGGQIQKQFISLDDIQRSENENNLTEKEQNEINENQNELSKQYDAWLDSLDETTLNEIYEIEKGESGLVEKQPTQRGKSETNVSNEKEAKEKRKKIAFDKIDNLAQLLKDALPGIKDSDIKTNGISQEQLIDLMAKSVKFLVGTGIEIDAAIKQVVTSIKDKLGVDIDPEDVKARYDKSEEKTAPKKEPKKNSTKQPDAKQKPQAVTTRAYKSENLANTAKDKLKELGLEYNVQSQTVAEENAKNIISEIGLKDAYILAKEAQIRGGARTYIQSKMIDVLNQQIFDAEQNGDLELVEYLSTELSIIIKEFADEKTLSGQEAAMLNRIYKTSDIKYDMEFAREQWKAKFDSEIPSNVEAILKKQEKEIKERDKIIKELETKIGTLQEQESVGNIKDVIKRHKKAKPSESTLKKAAAALRKAKFTKSISDLSKLQSNPADVIKGIFDGAIEVVAKALEAGSTIEQSVKKGINHIKQSDWYKNLSEKSKRQAEKIASDNFKSFLEKETFSIDKESENGKLKIPASLIYELVEGGIDNITDLTDAVLEVLQEEYPNLTHREVRDAITGYGKQINETQDEVKLKISKLKTDGKQASALDDLAMGQRPKRSGRKPKDYTAEQRNNIKKIRELLKSLPIDDSVDKEKYYKSALEGYKTRVKNRINDLNEAIKTNKRIINEKKNLPLDSDTELLIAERDRVQKEYDALFGKPYKSDETLINEIVKRKEKSLRDLQTRIEEIKLNKKEQEKPAKRNVSDPKIDALEQQIEKAKEELNEVLEEVGIAESKRLERAKKYIQRSIENYERRIKEGDFQPRKPKSYIYDNQLIDLKKKQIEAKIKYDLEFEKQEFKNLNPAEKVLEGIYKSYGTFKGVKSSFDLSAMLRQGLMLGSANPKEFKKATIDMHVFAGSSSKYQSWMTALESQNDYIYMFEDGLSITDTSGDVLRSEERFVGKLLQTQIKVFGIDLNLMNASERAYGGFLNSLRVSVYRKLVAEHEALGYTRQKNPKVFKNIAKFVNNATGRGTLTNDKRWAKLWNILFFSPKMITGNLGLLKDLVRSESTPYLKKQALKALMTYTVTQFLMKALLWQAYKLLIMPFTGEDDDDVTMDMNMVSTDFNKLKIGETRYDFGKGEAIMIRTLARMILQEKSKGIDYENVEFDNFTDTSMGELGNFFKNKLNPLLSQQIKWLNDEHPLDIMKSKEEATAVDYVQAYFIPITITEIVDGLENETPKSKLLFDTLLTIYGAGVQTYESSKKEEKKEEKKSVAIPWSTR
jgi:hypothetical protein